MKIVRRAYFVTIVGKTWNVPASSARVAITRALESLFYILKRAGNNDPCVFRCEVVCVRMGAGELAAFNAQRQEQAAAAKAKYEADVAAIRAKFEIEGKPVPA